MTSARPRRTPGGDLRVTVIICALAAAVVAALEIGADATTRVHALAVGGVAVGAAIASAIARRRGRPDLAAVRRGLEALRGFDAAVLLLGDVDGRILYVNDVAESVYGRSRDALLQLQLPDLCHPMVGAPRDSEEGRDAGGALCTTHVRGDGAPFPVEVITHRLALDRRDLTLAIVRDITEERLAEAALTESAELNRAVFDSVAMIQFALDPEGRFTLAEGRGLSVLRLKPGELVGRTIYDVARELPAVVKGFLRALGGSLFSCVYQAGRHAFDVHWAPLLRGDGTIRGVSGVAVDVSDRVAAEEARKETEAMLVAAERLASMGRLAAGVAHEINNPLAWVMSNLELAIDRLGDGSRDEGLRELLVDARAGAERVRDIVRDLRVFAKSDAVAGGGCDPAQVVRASLAMARNELRHRARVETSFEPVAPVAIPQRQLGQVLVNLLVNAAQAIPEGAAAEHLVRVRVRAAGEGVEIEVADDGAGMPPEVRDRIFEPFFTTKAGEGMGLGLSLCRTMVEEAGGGIRVESVPGRGSTFTLFVPTLAEASARQAVTPAPAPAPLPLAHGPLAHGPLARGPLARGSGQGRRSRLLVVDDEPLVGKTVARILAEHEVEYVPDARAALDRLHDGSRYDALICDLMMPEMTGMDLAERLAGEAHELSRRMVFLTGGAFTDRARTFVAFTKAPVVEKPFEHALLRRSVDRILRGERTAGDQGDGSPNT